MNFKADFHLKRGRDALESGDPGVAVREFRLAEQLGCLEAKIELAAICLGGDADCPQGGVAAEALLNEVIGHPIAPSTLVALALNNLASLYLTGAQGVQPDVLRASAAAEAAKRLGFPN